MWALMGARVVVCDRACAVGGEQDADPVVGEVPEAVSEAPGLFDDAVDGFGAVVGDPAGGEVGQDLGLPLTERSPESGDRLDRAEAWWPAHGPLAWDSAW